MNIRKWFLPLAGIMMLGTPGAMAAEALAPCPNSPNCVSSKAQDAKHGMPPLPYSGEGKVALEKIAGIIRSMPRAEIVKQTDNYLHAVFSSKIFKFKDDVEFLVDEEAGVIHFRSASRSGYSDFGVNRKRMDEISAKFKE